MSEKTKAMDAVGAARSVCEEAFAKLGKVMAKLLEEGRSTDQANRLRARTSRQILRYNRKLLELEAAAVIVNAPTTARIKEVRALIGKVREMAVADAMVAAGLKMISDSLTKAQDLAKEVRAG